MGSWAVSVFIVRFPVLKLGERGGRGVLVSDSYVGGKRRVYTYQEGAYFAEIVPFTLTAESSLLLSCSISISISDVDIGCVSGVDIVSDSDIEIRAHIDDALSPVETCRCLRRVLSTHHANLIVNINIPMMVLSLIRSVIFWWADLSRL